MGLERALAGLGAKLVRTQVGDRYVVETMRKRGYNFGGEQSGHLVFLDHATTGDGLVAALQVLGVMVNEEKPLSELARVLQRVPQVLHSVKLPQRRPIKQMPKLTAKMARVEKQLGDRGRLLVRWSGTEPKLRLMAEGPKVDKLKSMLHDLESAARSDMADVK